MGAWHVCACAHVHIHTHTLIVPYEEKRLPQVKECPRLSVYHQKLEEGDTWKRFFLTAFEQNQFFQHLGHRLLASRAMRQYFSVV